MKITYILLIVTCLSSCALSKKNTKTVAQNNLRTEKQSYLDKTEVKTTDKETRTYAWWNDSTMYQYQHVRERLDEAKTGSLKTKETTATKEEVLSKSNTSFYILVYAAIVMAVICGYIAYKKL
uniref:hypothetical protein n=1 Tax=Pedobacter schmidteae TaxID=2201271 RepID=UPI000EB5137A|nr:hypothetical protein [Pedobacter schmidteae]